MITPRAAYWLAAVLEVAGVLGLIVGVWPGVLLIVAGLVLQWLAGIAKQEAIYREWNREDQ